MATIVLRGKGDVSTVFFNIVIINIIIIIGCDKKKQRPSKLASYHARALNLRAVHYVYAQY